MTHQQRQPAGAPTGGQFAPTARAEGATSLVPAAGSSGWAAAVRDRARDAIATATVAYELAGARAAAEDILATYPAAASLDLVPNYDEDTTTWSGGRILDVHGARIGDFEEFEDEHWGTISDLPTTPRYRDELNAAGQATRTGDARYGFMSWTGTPRTGYTGVIDLRAAAALDLTALGITA